MKIPGKPINRRQFIGRGAQGMGFLAISGSAINASAQSGGADASASRANPFAYDVGRFAKTDVRLIGYEEVRRFTSPNPEPRRVSIGPGDRLHVANRSGVDVLDADGNRLGGISLSLPTRCVAAAGDGTVYAGVKDQVQVFDRKGQRTGTWEIQGKKTWLTGLAVGEQDVFAADSGNRVILRFDRAGKLLNRIGEKNKERGIPGLIVPSPYLDVALGRDNLVRVNNPGRHCVELYTASGDLELSWGKPSAAIEGFCGCCNPIGLTMLPDDSCITCEKGLPRVKRYSAERAFDCVVAGSESFPENAKAHDLSDCTVGGLDATVDSQGRVYVLDLVTAEVRVMRRKA
jgi:hypothetical protein